MNKYYILKILSTSLFAILTGILLFGLPLLDHNSPLFQISFLGMEVSSGLTFFNDKKYKEGVLLMLLIFVIQIIILKFNFIVTQLVFF